MQLSSDKKILCFPIDRLLNLLLEWSIDWRSQWKWQQENRSFRLRFEAFSPRFGIGTRDVQTRVFRVSHGGFKAKIWHHRSRCHSNHGEQPQRQRVQGRRGQLRLRQDLGLRGIDEVRENRWEHARRRRLDRQHDQSVQEAKLSGIFGLPVHSQLRSVHRGREGVSSPRLAGSGQAFRLDGSGCHAGIHLGSPGNLCQVPSNIHQVVRLRDVWKEKSLGRGFGSKRLPIGNGKTFYSFFMPSTTNEIFKHKPLSNFMKKSIQNNSKLDLKNRIFFRFFSSILEIHGFCCSEPVNPPPEKNPEKIPFQKATMPFGHEGYNCEHFIWFCISLKGLF